MVVAAYLLANFTSLWPPSYLTTPTTILPTQRLVGHKISTARSLATHRDWCGFLKIVAAHRSPIFGEFQADPLPFSTVFYSCKSKSEVLLAQFKLNCEI